MSTIIIGAGLSGLIAACHIPDTPIHEAAPEATQHKALLRFRSEAVSAATGIPFREVYAEKVLGVMAGDRSIWDLRETKRYIAPEDLHERLTHRHRSRIRFNTPLSHLNRGQGHAIISTVPLPTILAVCGLEAPKDMSFRASPIHVSRYRLRAGTDIHQTIYFPQANVLVYRASITGDLLIIERIAHQEDSGDNLGFVCAAFGIRASEVEPIEQVSQRYGKIVAVENNARRNLLHTLSVEFNVFSLGRFACWRNILLDDVIKDIGIVQRLIDASAYDRRLVLAK